MEQLKCIVDIAETYSITSTAQRLFMTQPAVSKSMKQLEKETGMTLLVRTNEGVYLTEQGKQFVEYAKRVLAEEERMAEWVRESRKNVQKSGVTEIRVCSASSITNIVLPDVIAKMDASEQNIIMKIASADTIEALLEEVQSKKSDIGFLVYNEKELYHKMEAYQSELQMDVLAKDHLTAVQQKKAYQDGNIMIDKVPNRIKTQYNIMTIDSYKESAKQQVMVSSNEAEFHRRMIEKNGAIVIMPRLAYQYFFNSKKYIAISMGKYDCAVLHVAIYRKDADEKTKMLAEMVRKEMYVK